MGTHRRRGQALVELALIAPILIVFLLGGSQVGAIAYAQVSLDTAAREGARAGVEAPNSSIKDWNPGGAVPSATHQCTAQDFTYGSPTGNPICIAVLNAGGYLSQSTFTSNPCGANQGCVTIKVIGETNLASVLRSPTVRLASAPLSVPMAAGSSCNGSDATITGTVSGIPGGQTATVTDTSNDTQNNVTSTYTLCAKATGSATSETITATVPGVCGGYSGSFGPINVTKGNTYTADITVTSGFALVTGTVSGIPGGQTATVTDSTGESTSNVTGSYTLCVEARGSITSQTLTAQVGSTSCGGYTGSSGSFAVAGGASYTQNFSVSAETPCGTSTTTTTTSSASSTSSATTSTSTGSGPGCSNFFVGEDKDYITVTVTYPVSVFVPIVGAIFDNGSGVHMITTSVTYAIEPCSLTLGA